MDLHSEFENSRFFNSARMDRRSADALVGLAAGITADDVVSLEEAQFLQRWLEASVAHLEDPVVNILYQRLDLMLRDGVLDAEESADLLHILRRFGGIELANTLPEQRYAAPNYLPFNHPVPDSGYGLKIMRAVELRDSGAGLAILGEEHWAKAVLG